MLSKIKKRAWEWFRCTRHNWLHLKMFQIHFDGNVWHVTDRDGMHMIYPFYPYLMYYEIEGYLRQGKWQLHEGMVVVDGGACFGEFSFYAAQRVGKTGRVLMLEPDAKNIEAAHQMFNQFGGKPANLEIVPAGLWKSPGVLRFAAGLGEASALLDPGQSPPPGATVTNVPVESLDSLVNRFGLKRMDLVKLDIEGAEIEVVQHAEELVQKMQPRFSIASYHLRDGQKTSALLEPMFRKMGYESATGCPGHPTTWGAKSL